MPRSVSEIEAEMAAAKEAKVHPASAKMRALRAELDAANGVASTQTSAESAVSADASPAPDPYQSDEWRFIEKACAEVRIEADGSMTNAAKKVYNVLDAKLKVWRIARAVVAQVGIGNKWPQFTDLGRDPNTGELLSEKAARTTANSPPTPAPAAPAPRVTDAGMPIRSNGNNAIAAAMAPAVEGLKEAFRASFRTTGDAQPAPAEPAAV